MENRTCVVSFRVTEPEKGRLERLARRWGRSVGETGSRLMREGLRVADFAGIEFRDSPLGRSPYLRGSRLQVWWVVRFARKTKWTPEKIARHLALETWQVKAALTYAAAFPEEIDRFIADYEAIEFEDLRRELPDIEVFEAGPEGKGRR